MYIEHYMTKIPVTVGPETPIGEVKGILETKHFRHLPVVGDDGCLLGMVTDRDIRSAYPSCVDTGKQHKDEIWKISQSPVGEIMSKDVVSLSSYATLDDALILLNRHKVGALPVIDSHHKVIGVFSVRDLIMAYTTLFGLGERGSVLVGVKDDGKPRPLTRIVHTLEEHDIHFSRVVRSKSMVPGQHSQTISVRVNTMNLRAVHRALEEAGFVVDPMLPEQPL
ncbi:MAG: CBS domain-containing protein [Proteobacteria bacterium]|nr:CBS domain-containing protein [Desulfobulbaceae bacterium]MBU4152442.1 CBS domain-containing protein [Pseudomonadota bacterium]MDP2105043.1 CBS domain-containing protein [Desulfobulbaceae bacterium]